MLRSVKSRLCARNGRRGPVTALRRAAVAGLAACVWVMAVGADSAVPSRPVVAVQPSAPAHAGCVPPDPAHRLLWGVNGHPLTAYPGIRVQDQVETVRRLGLRAYRVNVSSVDQLAGLRQLMTVAARDSVQVLPVLTPPLALDHGTPTELYDRARAFAERVAGPLRGQAPVWELGNELENYAIMRAGDRKDDGTPYNIQWGPAGGVSVDDYDTPRWARVSAVLRGLSDGVTRADPGARRAIGTAGWGHLGAFERMRRDGIAWDISVWHVYGDDPEASFREIARFGKPIWVTEFSAPLQPGAVDQALRAGQVSRMMQRIGELSSTYHVEAAFLYELFDEPYWGDTIEARFGMVSLQRRGGGWEIGRPNPIYDAVQKFTGGCGPPP